MRGTFQPDEPLQKLAHGKEAQLKLATRTLALGVAIGAMAAPAHAGPPAGVPTATDNPGTAHRPASTPTATDNPGTTRRPAVVGPNATLPAKARAYGYRCKDQSRKRSDAAEGTKGTPFSQCVTAMAKLANGSSSNPRTACKDLSRKRSDAAEGTRGTPFSQCVVQGAKLLRQKSSSS